MFETVEFPSGPAVLRGRLYAQTDAEAPCVVMTHGTSATIPMATDAYAEAIFATGCSVLLYDHAKFGISGGEPRQEINPWVQARGYRDAVAFLRSRPGCGRIAIWGDSYSAMVVLVAGALIPGLAAIVAQIPATGAALPEVGPSPERLEQIRAIFEDGDVSGGPEHTTGPMPVVSADQINAPSLLTPIQAFRWFIEYGGRHGSGWQNRATRVIPPTPVPFNAWLTAPYIEAPVLMMIGREDEMPHCNAEVQRAIFGAIPSESTLYEIDGGHFGLLWHPGALFDEAAAEQTAFLRHHLDLD